MKTLLENWKRYTTSLLNEDLLVESLEQAEQSVLNRAAKLVKGWIYENKKETFDFIQEKSNDEYGWKIGGQLILLLLERKIVPKDINENQKKLALMWSYRQLINPQNEGSLDTFLKEVTLFLSDSYYNEKYNDINFIADDNEHYFKRLQKLNRIITDYFRSSFNDFAYVNKTANLEEPPQTRANIFAPASDKAIQKSKLIENFFHWNRFIRNGKRDLNAVADYDELNELVQEAEPLYKAWQEKQEAKDAEAGKEVLLDNDNWNIIAIHNKGAALQFGKGSDLCTAAPGLEYFKAYYKPNDPLFGITNKQDNKKYQLSFGNEEFKYLPPSTEGECSYQVEIPKNKFENILNIMKEVVPPQYDVAYEFIQSYKK